MKRELKFRIWNNTIKYFVENLNGEIATFTLLTLSDYLRRNSITNIDDFIFPQYTGLQDKNKKPIYEGDIVKWGDLNYLIEWNDNACKWQGRCPYYHKYHHPVTEHFRYLMSGVIVGNIFQHSQLLERHEI